MVMTGAVCLRRDPPYLLAAQEISTADRCSPDTRQCLRSMKSQKSSDLPTYYVATKYRWYDFRYVRP